MSSLVLQPSSSLLPSAPYSVHGAETSLPASPSSSWSPTGSPQSRMHSLYIATSAPSAPAASASPVTAYTLPPPAQPQPSAASGNAVVAHVLSSPSRVQPTAAATAGQQLYAQQQPSPMSPNPTVISLVSGMAAAQQQQQQAAPQLSTVGAQSFVPASLQGGQTIVFDQNGQAFILSPITSVTPSNFQPAKPSFAPVQQQQPLQSIGATQEWVPSASLRTAFPSAPSAVSTQSNTIVLSQQPPLYQQAWLGGEASPMAVSSVGVQSQPLFSPQPFQSTLTVPMGSTVHYSHSPAQPFVLPSGALQHTGSPTPVFGSPHASLMAALSPVPLGSGAFQPLPKRTTSTIASPVLVPSLRPLSPAVTSLHGTKPASPRGTTAAGSTGSRTPQRRMSAASSSSSSAASSLVASSRHGGEYTEMSDMPTVLQPAPSFARNASESSGEHSTSPRIDGLSSSRLLTHINKKPSHVLPFVIHRSQLPHNFDHLVNSASSSSASATAQPSTPPHQPARAPSGSDMVTVNIRVMGGPALSELYFVAADISQLIHSRKSNIAKAVSVFTDEERARCSVVCPRSNNTQSTHILTVLTIAGVKRLLHSSRSTIALPLLAWLQDKVDTIVQQQQQQHHDNSGRAAQQTQQQQQRPPSTSSGGKRKSGGSVGSAGSGSGSEREQQQQQLHTRDGDVKEEDKSSDKRTKRD